MPGLDGRRAADDTGAYNNNVGIVQTSDYVVILNEMVHDHRVIPLDARPRVGEAIRLWMGSSRARWDGDTLVVSTTNFRPMVFRSASDQFTLTEKFTLVDAGTLLYEFTVNDPLTWVRPWTVQFPMTRIAEPIYGTRATRGTTVCGIFSPQRENRNGRRALLSPVPDDVIGVVWMFRIDNPGVSHGVQRSRRQFDEHVVREQQASWPQHRREIGQRHDCSKTL